MSVSKKAIINKSIGHIRSAFYRLGGAKKHIVFDAIEKFHYFHLEPIIKQIIINDHFEVTIIKWFNFRPEDKIDNVNYISFDGFQRNWLNSYDIFITTELRRRPYWFGGVSICMFHGVGPKISYIQDEAINDYDVIFSVGPTTFKIQKDYIGNTAETEILPIGLPATDRLISNISIPLPKSIGFEKKQRTILYAPSWSHMPENVSMNDEILESLSKLSNYNVIIRPHPLLLNPERCKGVDWKSKILSIESRNIKLSDCNEHSVYELLQKTDILLGDISSVTYEYLIFDRPIILYMRGGVLDDYNATSFVAPLLAGTTRLNKAADLEQVLKNIGLESQAKSLARQMLLDATLFNVGSATASAVHAIYKNTNG